ncbi:MAG: thioredoxin family protein, partial [Odoribacter sp.]
MKIMKIVVLGGLLLCGLLSIAQDRSIAFENISCQEAFDKAKQNNKLLFVDCYTSWCGPCKMLAKEVFTNNEVADYFNGHFVSLKVDCEKGEGPELRKRFGVESYPTLLFIDGEGKVVNKILGASKQPHFLTKVKEGLDPKNSLSNKEKEYEAGNRDRAFVMDLIESYKKQKEVRKAQKVSLEFLTTLSEQEILTKEIWEVVRDYYVSGYGSSWWNFILEHSDEYAEIVGKEAVVNKIGETLHPYLFGFSCGHSKSENKQDFETYKALVDRYQPKQKETLYVFIELGKSANSDDFNGYFETVMKTIPKLDRSEHYRFFANALDNLMKG